MKNLGSILLALAIIGSPLGMIGCSSDSKDNPVAPTTPNPYADQWFPLAENISTVWENTDYDSMGMGGMMYADTSAAHGRMRDGRMYYEYGVDLGERDGTPEDSLCLMMRNDSLFVHDFSAGASPNEALEAVFPPRTGVTWNGEWDSLPARWGSVGQRVTVPAGTFTDVAVLQFGPTTADASYKQFWFAKGVGVIQVKMWMDRMDGNQHNVMPMHSMQMRAIMYP